MTINEMKDILLDKYNYDKVQVEKAIIKVDAISPDIRVALEEWIKTGETSSPTYEDYNVVKIIEKKKDLTVLGAYLFLDWIRREPKIALKALGEIHVKKL